MTRLLRIRPSHQSHVLERTPDVPQPKAEHPVRTLRIGRPTAVPDRSVAGRLHLPHRPLKLLNVLKGRRPLPAEPAVPTPVPEVEKPPAPKPETGESVSCQVDFDTPDFISDSVKMQLDILHRCTDGHPVFLDIADLTEDPMPAYSRMRGPEPSTVDEAINTSADPVKDMCDAYVQARIGMEDEEERKAMYAQADFLRVHPSTYLPSRPLKQVHMEEIGRQLRQFDKQLDEVTSQAQIVEDDLGLIERQMQRPTDVVETELKSRRDEYYQRTLDTLAAEAEALRGDYDKLMDRVEHRSEPLDISGDNPIADESATVSPGQPAGSKENVGDSRPESRVRGNVEISLPTVRITRYDNDDVGSSTELPIINRSMDTSATDLDTSFRSHVSSPGSAGGSRRSTPRQSVHSVSSAGPVSGRSSHREPLSSRMSGSIASRDSARPSGRARTADVRPLKDITPNRRPSARRTRTGVTGSDSHWTRSSVDKRLAEADELVKQLLRARRHR